MVRNEKVLEQGVLQVTTSQSIILDKANFISPINSGKSKYVLFDTILNNDESSLRNALAQAVGFDGLSNLPHGFNFTVIQPGSPVAHRLYHIHVV